MERNSIPLPHLVASFTAGDLLLSAVLVVGFVLLNRKLDRLTSTVADLRVIVAPEADVLVGVPVKRARKANGAAEARPV